MPQKQLPPHAQLIKLGQAIRIARKERGISQETLANMSDIDRSYMGGIERALHNPTFATLGRICGSLDLSLAELMLLAGV